MTTKLIYKSYQSALTIAVVIQIIGALFYFITAVYVVRDQVCEEVSYNDDKSQIEKYKEADEDDDNNAVKLE